MRDLGGAVQFEHVARGIVAADGAARFHRHAGMAADREFELDDHVRAAQRGLHFAVALVHDRHLGVAAGREFAGRGVGGEQDRQLLDLHGHQLGRVLGDVRVMRKHRRDRFADITHASIGEDRLPVGFELLDATLAEIDRADAGNVGRGPHRDHAGQRARRAHVDRDDAAMRVVRARDAHVELMREGDVAGKAAAAGDERRILQPLDRETDPLLCFGGRACSRIARAQCTARRICLLHCTNRTMAFAGCKAAVAR